MEIRLPERGEPSYHSFHTIADDMLPTMALLCCLWSAVSFAAGGLLDFSTIISLFVTACFVYAAFFRGSRAPGDRIAPCWWKLAKILHRRNSLPAFVNNLQNIDEAAEKWRLLFCGEKR